MEGLRIVVGPLSWRRMLVEQKKTGRNGILTIYIVIERKNLEAKWARGKSAACELSSRGEWMVLPV